MMFFLHTLSEPRPASDPMLWVDDHGDFLYRFAWYRVNNEDIARDLVQETFLAGLKATFSGKSSVRTWLTGILKRKIADHYRDHYRHSADSQLAEESDSDFIEDGPKAGHWKPERAPKDWENLPDSVAEQSELRRILETCIQKLPELTSKVFKMKEIDDLETVEITGILQITENNIWVILHRARKQLRKCLEVKYLA